MENGGLYLGQFRGGRGERKRENDNENITSYIHSSTHPGFDSSFHSSPLLPPFLLISTLFISPLNFPSSPPPLFSNMEARSRFGRLSYLLIDIETEG